MPKSIRLALLSLRDLLTSAAPFILVGVALLWLAFWWLNPMPPKKLVQATGPAQSAYAAFGERYAKALAKDGIQVELLPSEGSSANLLLLREGKADVGFVQGGTADPMAQDAEEPAPLLSLGGLFVEPIWLFYREGSARRVTPTGKLGSLSQLRRLRVNVGTPGSGVPNLMNTLLELNGVQASKLQLSKEGATESTVGLLNGDIDALVFASAPEAPIVQMLLQTPGIRLMDFGQNEAYSRRLSFVSPVVLPRGVVNLARNVPAQDVRLIATTTTLLAREDVHPALLQLMSQATLALHGEPGWFNRAREYPKAIGGEYALATEAERTLRTGVPPMQRYLSFSIANLVERMWLAMGIIIAVLLPLGKIAPPLYEFRVRSRIFRWYGQLRDIEDRLEADATLAPALMQELDALEARVEKVVVPLSYADELYALRNHIALVRNKLLSR